MIWYPAGKHGGDILRFIILTVALVFATASSTMAQGRWQSASRLDAARAGLAVTTLEGRVYAAGGAGLTNPHVEFESYDPEIDRWFSETSLPVGLERFGLAAINGRVYAAGGYAPGDFGIGPSAQMWSWSPEGGVWQSETAMPAPKADFSLVAVDGRLYALGGVSDDQSIFVFDPEDKSWETLDVPEGLTRRGAGVTVVEDVIYVIGGHADGQTRNTVDIYDPRENLWSDGPDLPDARSGVAAAYYRGRIHVFGGRGEDQRVTLSAHSSLAVGDQSWTDEAELPAPRTAADAAVLNEGIFVVGGGSGGGFFAPFTALDATDVFVDEAS
jgi:N-acetylneuraminic acid mutarotase